MPTYDYKGLSVEEIVAKLKNLEKEGIVSLDMHDDIVDSKDFLRQINKSHEMPPDRFYSYYFSI